MRKTLLLLAAIVLSTVSASAQVLQLPKGIVKRNSITAIEKPVQKKAAKKINLADNQLLLGGYTTDDVATSQQGLGLISYPGTLGAAILLDASDFIAFDGGKVVKIRVGLANSAKVSRVFITPILLSGNIGDAIVSQETDFNTVGWNEVELTEPVTLELSKYQYILLGFDYVQGSTRTNNSYPLSYVQKGAKTYSSYIYGNLGNGTSWYNIGTESYGNLSVQAVVEKEFDSYSAKPLSIGNVVVVPNGEKKVNVPVQNLGKQDITSIGYSLNINGQLTEGTATLNGVGFGQVGYAEVAFPGAAEEKTQRYSLTINKVNGEDNASTQKSTAGLLATSTKTFEHRVAIEEFTGTGCPWCPRGIVGMEKLRNDKADKFVGIAIHQYNNSDPMFISYDNYADLGFSSAPSCAVERKTITDPYYGDSEYDYGISDLFDQVANQDAYHGAELTAKWNSDFTAVDVVAKVESAINGAQYSLELVLLGDSLTGTASSWRQTNNYTAYSAEQVGEDLAIFANGGQYGTSYINNFKFNDVALASSYKNGSNELAPFVITSDGATINYTLNLPTATALNNAIRKELVYVAALIIDPASGYVLNANKVHVEGFDPVEASVNTISTTATGKQQRFSLDGRQLTAPQRGLNIIRMADGSTRKVVVK